MHRSSIGDRRPGHWLVWFTVLVTGLGASKSLAQCPLVWSDEFDGTALNTNIWEPLIGDGCFYGICGWGNNEWQWYTSRPENIEVADGYLKIIARNDNWQGHAYTSARLRTLNNADFRYGRLEARIKLPRGQGIWPAFWMLPTGSPYGGWPFSGEIDIMEAINNVNAIHGTIHYGNPKGEAGGTYYPSVDVSQTFNVYAIEWEPTEIRWYFNGINYSTVTDNTWYTSSSNDPGAPFNQNFHFLLNVAIGGNWPGYPDASTQFPQELVVDYVRVYELCGDGPFHGQPIQIPGRVEAEDFDIGEQGSAYNDTTPENLGGAYRDGAVDIEVATEGSYNIGFMAPGEWLDYTVSVAYGGLYNIEARVASALTGGSFQLELDGTPITGTMIAPGTSGWQTWTTITTTAILSPGQQKLRFANSNLVGEYNITYFDFYLAADSNRDTFVNFSDAVPLLFCISGPDVTTPLNPSCVGQIFADSDIDQDSDSDVVDMAEVQRAFTGS